MPIRKDIISRMEEMKELPKNNGRLTASALAKIINPSNPKSFSTRFSQYKHEYLSELHFCEYYQIGKLLFKDNFKDVFTKWCFHFRTYENIINAFEFASTNRRFDLTDHLLKYVDNLKVNTDIVPELKEVAEIYRIVKLYQQRALPNKRIRQILRRFYPRYKIGQALKTILECNTLYLEFDFRSINRLVDDVRVTINALKRPYIIWSLKIRLFELLSQLYLYAKSNTKKCRKYAKLVIKSDIGRKFVADSYSVIGMSYLYENREKCLNYIGINHRMVLDDHRPDLAKIIRDSDVAFVNNIWGIYSPTDDLSEQAHYEAKWGDKEKAKKLIDEAIRKDGVSAFKLLYNAIAYNDLTYFSKAFALFLSGDNKFHAKMVIDHVNCPMMKQQFETILNTYNVY